MHACEMTLAYLRGGLSTCSVVWVEFEYFSLKFINILMQLRKNFLQNFKNYGSYLNSFSKAVYACATLFLKSASFAVVSDFGFGVKVTISRVISSIFSDLTC